MDPHVDSTGAADDSRRGLFLQRVGTAEIGAVAHLVDNDGNRSRLVPGIYDP